MWCLLPAICGLDLPRDSRDRTGQMQVRGGQGHTLCCRKQNVVIWMSVGQAADPVVASLQPEE